MSVLRRAIPLFVAAATGIASGIYIFKPIVDSQTNDLKLHIPKGDDPSVENTSQPNGDGNNPPTTQ